jgi:hypothetical protein
MIKLEQFKHDGSNNKLFTHPSSKPINYSDGENFENYIYDKIINSKDVSIRSQDLKKAIIDWPSKYHFSLARSFLCILRINYQFIN